MPYTVLRTDRDPECAWEIRDTAQTTIARFATEALARSFAGAATAAVPFTPDAAALEALQDLVEWSARTGGWDSPAWDRARALLSTDRPSGTYLVRRCHPERTGSMLIAAAHPLRAIEAAKALTPADAHPSGCYTVDPYDPENPVALGNGVWILTDVDGSGLYEIQADDDGPLPAGHDDRAVARARQQARSGSAIAVEACRLHDRDAAALADKRARRTTLERIAGERLRLTTLAPGADSTTEVVSWDEFVSAQPTLTDTDLPAIADMVLSGATYHSRNAAVPWTLQIDET